MFRCLYVIFFYVVTVALKEKKIADKQFLICNFKISLSLIDELNFWNHFQEILFSEKYLTVLFSKITLKSGLFRSTNYVDLIVNGTGTE